MFLCVGMLVSGYLSPKTSRSPSFDYVQMNLMAIDDRGRRLHGTDIYIRDRWLGKTDVHGQWNRLIRLPIDTPLKLEARKNRLSEQLTKLETITLREQELIATDYKHEYVLQLKP